MTDGLDMRGRYEQALAEVEEMKRALREHAQNVEAVAIRQLSNSEAVLAGGRSKAEQHSNGSVRWVYAPDGAGLAEQLLDEVQP